MISLNLLLLVLFAWTQTFILLECLALNIWNDVNLAAVVDFIQFSSIFFLIVEKERRVRANDPEYNASFNYAVSKSYMAKFIILILSLNGIHRKTQSSLQNTMLLHLSQGIFLSSF